MGLVLSVLQFFSPSLEIAESEVLDAYTFNRSTCSASRTRICMAKKPVKSKNDYRKKIGRIGV